MDQETFWSCWQAVCCLVLESGMIFESINYCKHLKIKQVDFKRWANLLNNKLSFCASSIYFSLPRSSSISRDFSMVSTTISRDQLQLVQDEHMMWSNFSGKQKKM